jgi:hypothetical protein
MILIWDSEIGNTELNSRSGDSRNITAEEGPGSIYEKGAKKHELKRNPIPMYPSMGFSSRPEAFKLASAGMRTSQRSRASIQVL